MKRLVRVGAAVASLAAVALPGRTPLAAQALDSTTVSAFRWRNVGPSNFMGRLADVQGIPSPSKTIYVSSAAGGVWKSMNNGVSWRPIFDDKDVASGGMLAIAPTDTNIIWLGTGEPNVRNSIEPGAGVYKSTNGGATWSFMGLKETQHIGRIQIDPKNANIVYVAASGPAWKAGGDRGLYKTTDGGTTWKLIKAGANTHTGAIDVQIDPSNSNILYLAMWERYRTPFSLISGGSGSGLFKSTDAGATWTEIKGKGYPEGAKGRIGLAIAPSNSQVIYALTEASSKDAGPMSFQRAPAANGLYRSTDGGNSWTQMNNYDTRPFYYSQVRVDPKNADRVYFSSTQLQVSNDGGKTLMNAAQSVHVDDHGIWIDPNDPERWFLANDGGIAITFDRGGNFWYPMNFPIGQFYDISYDFAVPYNICAGAQDNGAWCGPSKKRGVSSNNDWVTISGGDGFYTAQDPTNPNMVWGSSQNAGIQQTNLKTGERGRVNKPTWNERYRDFEDSIAIVRGDPLKPATREAQTRIDALRAQQKKDSADLQIRYNWESPYFLSPHNPQVFYLGGSRVLKSVKGGADMYPISGDLSVKTDPAQARIMAARIDTVDKFTGGITLDLTGAEAYGTVVAMQESPVKPGLLLAGTDNGNVWITHNDGAQWENLSSKFTALGVPWDAYVVRLEPSHFDTLSFYVAFENHRWNDFTPYLFVTNDGGRTFKSIVNNLPKTSVADYVHVIREDPHNRDLLFVGTSRSVYASIDRGQTWSRFAANFPTTPVYDLQIHPRDHDLMAATHGRSLWIADIAALEQMTPKVVAQGNMLYKPKPAFQWGEGPQLGLPGNGWGQAVMTYASPAYGADIVYRVATAATGAVRVLITNGAGDTVATLNGSGNVGVQRVNWNFATAAPRRATAVEQTPSQKRDSILLRVRAPQVLDSLTKAGFDTAAIRTVRAQVAAATSPTGAAGQGGRGGGGGGGGGRGGGGGQACDHPTTQWDTFCVRPAETPGGGGRGAGGGAPAAPFGVPAPDSVAAAAGRAGGRGGAAGGRGGRGAAAQASAVAGLNPTERIWSMIGMNAPGGGGGRGGGGGGGGFGGGGGGTAGTGDYLVHLTINGQTYRQPLHVERISGGDAGAAFGGDDEHDQGGRYTPIKGAAKSKSK